MPNDLADRLVQHCVNDPHARGLPQMQADMHAAAVLLRVQGEQLDTLRNAIGDPCDIEWLASACLDEAMACQQIGGFGETVGVLSQAAVALQRVAAAGGGVPEEGATDEQ